MEDLEKKIDETVEAKLNATLDRLGERMERLESKLELEMEIGETCTPRRYNRSRSIAQLATALAKAQGEIKHAVCDGKSNFGVFATLSSVWDACREALSKNGIAVIQPATRDGNSVVVTTILSHSSGEYMESELELPMAKFDAWAVGSGISYAKRYALAAMVGVAPKGEDDDGLGAVGGHDGKGDQKKAQTNTNQAKNEKKSSAPTGKTDKPSTQSKPAASAPAGDKKAEKKDDPKPPKGPEQKLTDPQVKKLLALIEARKESGWTNENVKLFVSSAWGVASATFISPDQYDELLGIVDTMEALHALEMAGVTIPKGSEVTA